MVVVGVASQFKELEQKKSYLMPEKNCHETGLVQCAFAYRQFHIFATLGAVHVIRIAQYCSLFTFFMLV